MGAQTRYRAFISYSHEDQRWARRIHRALEAYRVPSRLVGRATDRGEVPKKLTPIFRDREDLSAAEDLSDAVRSALAASDSLIVVCSPAAAKSQWVNREVLAYREVNPEGRILTAVIADPERGCFPPALLEEGPDGAVAEPLAADLRDEGDGQRGGLLKLVAGLLGLELDALIRRDHQRRQARVTAITALSLSLSIVMSALTVFALSAQSEAERREAEAEDLIVFMLEDLRENLEPVGRLDVLESVAEKVIEHYGQRPQHDLGADELGRRAMAFHLLGDIRVDQGDLTGAFRYFADAFDATSRLLALEPDNTDRIFEHSQSAYWVGYIAWQQGDVGEAEVHFIAYRDLIAQLVEIDPSNAEWQAETGYANTNLGVIYGNSGRLAEARESHTRALSAKLDLARREGAPARAWTSVANTYAWLAAVEDRVGNREGAIEALRAQVGIFEGPLAGALDDWTVRSAALSAEMGLARTLISDPEVMTPDDLALALAMFEVTAAEAQAFLAHDPDNVDWRVKGVRQYLWRAQGHLYAGDTDAARNAQVEATRILSHASMLEDNSNRVRAVQWHAALIEARILAARGQNADAVLRIDHLMSMLDQQDDWGNEMISAAYSYAAAGNTLADVLWADGERDQAMAVLRVIVERALDTDGQLGMATEAEYRRARERLQQEQIAAE